MIARGLEVIDEGSEGENGFARLCLGPSQKGAPCVSSEHLPFLKSPDYVGHEEPTPSSEPDIHAHLPQNQYWPSSPTIL